MSSLAPVASALPPNKKLVLLTADASVKGVRPTQEDRHIAILDLQRYISELVQQKSNKGIKPDLLRKSSSSDDRLGGWSGGYLSGNDTGDLALFGVFDGHNGQEASDYCELNIPRIVSKYVNEHSLLSTEDLMMAFVDCDRAFLNDSKVPEKSGGAMASSRQCSAGCTAVVAAFNTVRKELLVGHTGDTRCLVSKDGVAKALTARDHKPYLESETARIKKAGHFVANKRLDGMLAVSRAIGDRMFKQNAYQEIATVKKKKLKLKWTGSRSKSKKRKKKKKKKPSSPANSAPHPGTQVQASLDLAAASKMALTAVPDVSHYVLDLHQSGDDAAAGDQFAVIACDGLFDVMSNQEVVDWVLAKIDSLSKAQSRRRRRGRGVTKPAKDMNCEEIFELMERCRAEDPIFNIAEALAGHALELGTKDNVTVLVVFFTTASTTTTESKSSDSLPSVGRLSPTKSVTTDDWTEVQTRVPWGSFSMETTGWTEARIGSASTATTPAPSMQKSSALSSSSGPEPLVVLDASRGIVLTAEDLEDSESESDDDDDDEVSQSVPSQSQSQQDSAGVQTLSNVVIDSEEKDSYDMDVATPPVRFRNSSTADMDESIAVQQRKQSALNTVAAILLNSPSQSQKKTK